MGFLGLFPTEQEKEARQAAEVARKEAKEQPEQDREDKEMEWSDTNEDVKFVMHGAKVQCQFCSPPIADIIVTSNTVMLQGQPFATVKDKDGIINFNFVGLCNHPSQQKPLCPPPPCKSVINLGEWEDYSDTMINEDNALLVRSKIKCNVSGTPLQIIDSGQKAELTQIKPKTKRQPRVVDAYWKEEGSDDKLYIEIPGRLVTLFIETEDYKQGDYVTVVIKAEEGKTFINGSKEMTVSGEVNEKGILIKEGFCINYK